MLLPVLAVVSLLLVSCVVLLVRIEKHARKVADFSERLRADTSALFPCYSASAIDWAKGAVDRAFTAYENTEWSDAMWNDATVPQRVEMFTKRAHVGRAWNLAIKQRDFRLQANIDVGRGARTVADIRAEEQKRFGNIFEVIVPAAIKSAITEAIADSRDFPPILEKYASGEQWHDQKRTSSSSASA